MSTPQSSPPLRSPEQFREDPMVTELPADVLDLLVCPSCHTKLAWDYEASELVCTGSGCGLAYPVRDGIPILLIDEARRPGNAG